MQRVSFKMIESVSRRAFSGASGTYNVRASELACNHRHKTLSSTVIFLDDSEHTFQIEKRAKGKCLLELVFQHLELVEKDYFGLQYTENELPPSPSNTDSTRWLDPLKPVKKQIKSGGPLYFRVKFYVCDPSKLQEEYTRYHFYLQIRKDILYGRLQLPIGVACLLASYTVQSELGDYQSDEHGPGYLTGLTLIPGQSADLEAQIAELHRLHRGQTPADAEFNFLDHAKRLGMYGVELHRARDVADREIQIGVSALGLVVFHNNIRVNTFSWGKIAKISFKRKQFIVQLRREAGESYDACLCFAMRSYRSAKTLWRAGVEHHTFFRLHSPTLHRRRFALTLGSKFTYSGRTQAQTAEEGRLRSRPDRCFVRSPSKRIQPPTSIPEDKHHAPAPPVATSVATPAPVRQSRPYDNKVTSLGSREPRRAWSEVEPAPSTVALHSDDEGGFQAFSPVLPPHRAISYVDDECTDEGSSGGGGSDEMVIIRLRPDEQGRFGFNVKGGPELAMPILVSRVAPHTPADRSHPRLCEGDQVVRINGRLVAGLSHENVVGLIRAARDSPAGELVLSVRPRAPGGPPVGEEPPYEYVPEGSAPGGGDALVQSMFLLGDGLASGALVAQFESLYRRNSSLSIAEARRPENIAKNRYRDVAPYDNTRVILRNATSGDYINANHVRMEVATSGVVNRYIATQGPLASTFGDFWQMVLESESTLIMMVTPLVERGRTKCHQYWPGRNDTLDAGNGLRITCTRVQAEVDEGIVRREFRLSTADGRIERHVTQVQYVAWPDHGVPADAGQFLNFCLEVRRLRQGMVEPAIVHCSAGVGRTGVLILMEAAMCLIEANEPVYPLDIVRTMREQRPMMIQTAAQYRFVCEAVHRAYTETLVRPLPEFRR